MENTLYEVCVCSTKYLESWDCEVWSWRERQTVYQGRRRRRERNETRRNRGRLSLEYGRHCSNSKKQSKQHHCRLKIAWHSLSGYVEASVLYSRHSPSSFICLSVHQPVFQLSLALLIPPFSFLSRWLAVLHSVMQCIITSYLPNFFFYFVTIFNFFKSKIFFRQQIAENCYFVEAET